MSEQNIQIWTVLSSHLLRVQKKFGFNHTLIGLWCQRLKKSLWFFFNYTSVMNPLYIHITMIYDTIMHFISDLQL